MAKKPTPLPQLPREPIKSSMFDEIGYDANTRELQVRMKGGKIYSYSDVPIEKVEALKGNQSPGSYFHRRIRGIHAHSIVPPVKS